MEEKIIFAGLAFSAFVWVLNDIILDWFLILNTCGGIG
jgi:hypothetical protein